MLKEDISESTDSTSQSQKNAAGDINATGGASLLASAAGLKAKISGKLSSSSTINNTKKTSAKFSQINVAATFAGSKIHWEINPRGSAATIQTNNYLDGNVFQTGKTDKLIDACIMEAKTPNSMSNITIVGSVFTSMQDLIVGRIEFTDELGTVGWSKVDKSELSNNANFALSFQTATKERLLKQIIRKHLVGQGMKTDGARVEICRAEA